MSQKKIEFDLPEGFSPPDQMPSNNQFEVLATLQMKPNGRACLVAIDGYRMPGYRSGEENDGKSYAQAASEAMDKEGDY